MHKMHYVFENSTILNYYKNIKPSAPVPVFPLLLESFVNKDFSVENKGCV